MESLTLSDFEALSELRYQIRRFLSFSEQAARAAGLEPRQHQLMLGLKGLPSGKRPTIGELAERMQIQHHSAVELVNRLGASGYIRRARGGDDRREVLLVLTAKGERVLRKLSLHHRAELRTAGPALVKALRRAMRGSRASNGTPAKTAVGKRRSSN
jgi:DNA-binding MarR family transcriptional regulator